MKRFFYVLIFVLILSFIWARSCKPAPESEQESNFVMQLIAPILELVMGKGNVTLHMVRKMAHYTEFAFLGIFSYLSFGQQKKSRLSGILLSFLICFIAASLDETIQIFFSRGPSLIDVWIDAGGAFIGLISTALIPFCI